MVHMSLPLEDTFADIIGKAQRGLKFADTALTQRAVEALKSGNYDSSDLDAAAQALGLGKDRLVKLAQGAYQPAAVAVDGLAQLTTPYEDFTVNAYVVWDPATKAAVVFDTGADATPILDLIQKEALQVNLIFITHTHPDHISELDTLMAATGGVPIFCNAREPHAAAKSFEITDTLEWQTGGLTIQPRSTWGHSRGGTTYLVKGLARPVAIVGDAVFAGSMGGGIVSYADALETNRTQILTLPDDTVIASGHGPLTSVGEEKINNPFFN